jgi:hypothetical protein
LSFSSLPCQSEISIFFSTTGGEKTKLSATDFGKNEHLTSHDCRDFLQLFVYFLPGAFLIKPMDIKSDEVRARIGVAKKE